MTQILSKYSNLTQRIIVALIGGIGLIGAIIYSPYTFFIVFFFICMFSMLEFYKLVGLDGYIPLKSFGTAIGLFLFTASFLVSMKVVPSTIFFLVGPFGSMAFFIKLYKKGEKKPFTNIAFTFLGILYVSLPFALLNLGVIRDGEYSWQIILGILLMHWANDSGAYFAGTKFGKTKLFERVSPKKSWEGSIGGTLTTLALAFVLGEYFTDLRHWEWLVMSAIVVIAGTYGDLIESLLKRSMEIKDSGSTIPGHGGFLDRFDGLLLSAPFLVAFLRII
ncbi:phosphatidate cytidylyltransferase [Marinigracilibium pacificum]|uniref:Phosphatidate cytidylyltransferase n=1 Tax=Marinigracilibium pacificum TaxID=2729599 RepID=A0A848IQY7_9BACT|nr:phosphatidate cytidylyltransferase [Marinigracilibium pacificum]NMM46873.1 phosphatidate cytidylyltransferase [Marinigracilibium pacificum]